MRNETVGNANRKIAYIRGKKEQNSIIKISP